MSLDGDREHADHRHARYEEAQCVAEAVGERGPAGDGTSRQSARRIVRGAVPLEAEGRKLRAPGQRLDELGRERAARPCISLTTISATGTRRRRARRPRRAGGRFRGRALRPEGRRGEHDRGRSRDQRDEGRLEAAQIQVLERVDVADEPRQEVAAAGALELSGREWLDRLVHLCAGAAERAQRDVVRREPFEIPREGPREPEKRTPTMAAVSESTAGCSAALEIR